MCTTFFFYNIQIFHTDNVCQCKRLGVLAVVGFGVVGRTVGGTRVVGSKGHNL